MTIEITKMMTISTAHISEKTRELLSTDSDQLELTVYPKGDVGWFVYVPNVIETFNDSKIQGALLPNDLRDCLKLASEQACSIICFDRDAEPILCLEKYDYEEPNVSCNHNKNFADKLIKPYHNANAYQYE